MTPSLNVCFVGLGRMGAPMARRIGALPSVALSVHDRLAVDLDVPTIRVTASLAEAVGGADVVCTMLPGDENVLEVAEQLRSVGSAGQVLVDFSTTSAEAVATAATTVAPTGIDVVGASCMKSVAAAESGTLSLFVGGDPGPIEQVRPLLDAVASQWQVVGPPATAKSLKIANNHLTAVTGFALLDALVLARAAGVGAHDAVERLREAGADSWVLDHHVVDHALRDDLGPGIFGVDYMTKDVRLASRAAVQVHRPALFAGLVLAAYRGTSALGLATSYHPVVVRWLELIAGQGPVTEPPPAVSGRPPGPEVWRGLARVQDAAVEEVLGVLEASGIDRSAAVEWLQSGSARSAALGRATVRGTARAGSGDLTAASSLADSVGVPALSVAVAQAVAIGA